MNDPIDGFERTLTSAFGDVPVPDLWDEITIRAAGPPVEGPVDIRRRSDRRGWLTLAGAAAVVALVVAGMVVIGQRGNDDVPPVTPVDTIAPPVDSVVSVPGCTADTIDEVHTFLRDGVGDIDYEPAPDVAALVGRTHTMVAANVETIERSDGFTRLLLDDVVVLDGREMTDSVAIRSTTTLSEPLEWLGLTGVRVVAFARSISSAPEWVVDPEGLFIGCADGSTPARSVLADAPTFLDTSSIGALEAQLVDTFGGLTEPPITTAPQAEPLVISTEPITDTLLSELAFAA